MNHEQLSDNENYGPVERNESLEYEGREASTETCIHVIGYWKNAQCGDPVDGRDGGCFCTAHAIEVNREQLQSALLAGDYELANEYEDSLRKLGAGREEMRLAA